MRILLRIVTCVAVITISAMASAQVLFEIAPSQETGNPGATVVFTGSLSNQNSTDVFFNGYVTSPIDPHLTLDDTLFFTNAPLSLGPGQAWSGEMFSIIIGETAPIGDYLSDFALLGGADASSLDAVASAPFTTRVASTPEYDGHISLMILFAFVALWIGGKRATVSWFVPGQRSPVGTGNSG